MYSGLRDHLAHVRPVEPHTYACRPERAAGHPQHVIPAGRQYAVVVSIDGAGQITLHFPRGEGDGEVVLTDGAPYSLPTSYELDDAPDFERFFLIMAEHPLDPAEIFARARELAKRRDEVQSAPLEELPEGTSQSSFLLKKAR